jgi:hypothetical protein
MRSVVPSLIVAKAVSERQADVVEDMPKPPIAGVSKAAIRRRKRPKR